MPTPLNAIDLSSAVIGTTGIINLANAAVSAHPQYAAGQRAGTLQLFNESGCGLRLAGKNTGPLGDLMAGGWRNLRVAPGETEIDYVVLYVLTNPPVSQLVPTYYAVGEPVPEIGTLGNSPVGGGVQTNTVQQASLSGATSGVAKLYEVVEGSMKRVTITFNNFLNGGVPVQTLALPTAFTAVCHVQSDDAGAIVLVKSGVSQTVSQIVSQTAGADATISPQTTIHQGWTCYNESGFDTIQFNGSDAGPAHGGIITLIGV